MAKQITLDNWEEVSPQTDIVPVWDYKKDKEIVGIYKTALTNIGPNKSNMYHLETENGVVGVWGTSLLDSRFAQISLGSKVKLVYEGFAKSDKTGRNYHNFKTFISKA